MGGKRICGRKRHLSVDTQGNLLTLRVHQANIADRDGAADVLFDTHDLCPTVTKVFVDQGYTGDDLADWCRLALDISLEVVHKERGVTEFRVLPKRWIVERTIAWLNRNRRLAKDYERHLTNSEAMVYWASIQRMVRVLRPDASKETSYCRKRKTNPD